MTGIIFSIFAGFVISIQNVFNTRLGENIGMIETTVVVHAVGLAFAIIATMAGGDGSFKAIKDVNKLYLIGGALGVMIVYGVMKGISLLGPTFSVAIVIVAQLTITLFIDVFGLFDSPRIKFDFTKPLGILIMIAGIIVFKLRG
ncbi:MAG: DMT family transporter [Firmicutes bacterium]|nr:DMT family transporter [Bacillota bacterium]